jgi:PAS domain S-box-containing protein
LLFECRAWRERCLIVVGNVKNLTVGTDPEVGAAALASVREADHALLIARSRVGLRVVFVAIALFALADLRLGARDSWAIVAVRALQFLVIGLAALGLRVRIGWRARVVTVTAFISAIYVTSAVAGTLRGGPDTQPVTDIAIAFTTATTLPWGPWAQLASVLVAMTAMGAHFYAVHGSLSAAGPHMVAGLGVAFLVSVYITHQLERYRHERDRAEAALRRSEERFRSLIEHGSDIITIVDGGGLIRYESPSIARVLGFAPGERVGTLASSHVHPDDLPAVRAAQQGRGGAPVECRVKQRDGSWCPVEAVFTDLLAHPAVHGIVVNWRDVSDRRAAEDERARYVVELARARDQALESTRAKSMFLANVSHEIRTPMNVIIGMTDMVLDSALADDQREQLGRVRAAALGLLGIINDILDASKIEAGKMTIEHVEMDLRGVIGEAAGLLTPAAQAKGLALAWDVAADVPPRVKGDPVRIRQTLVNLLTNAVKFTDAGAVRVEAAAVRRSASHVVVRVAVADTGIGIPPERQATIFESFAQGDDTTTRFYGGTGLGLTICRQLVMLMGGHIGVESEPGRGSRFWFELAYETVAVRHAAA